MGSVTIRLILGACLSLVLVCFSLPAADEVKEVQTGAEWPLFRGNPLQNGVASQLPERLEILWQFKTEDSIEGAAAIVNGMVYVGSYDQHLYAIELATGKQKWKYKAGPFKASPSVRDGRVFIGDSDGIFHCVDAASGKKLWTVETEAEITSGANFVGDKVLFGSYDESLYCLTLDGQRVWKYKINGPVNGSPAVVGNRTFVAGCDSTLHVVDTDTGKQIAAVELGGQAGATAAILGDQLYVGTMGNEVLGIDWKKAQIIWKYEAEKRQQAFYASAAVTDKLVIVGSRDRVVHAINRQTGKKAWTFPTQNRVDSSPVVVGKRVFVGSFDQNLYVLDLEKGTEQAKFRLDAAIAGSPAVAENCLVIGTNKGTVYCFGAKK